MLRDKVRFVGVSPEGAARGAAERLAGRLDVVKLMADALPDFAARLLPAARPGDVWLVQEDSPGQLRQALLPIGEVERHLATAFPKAATERIAADLRGSGVKLEPGQIFFVFTARGGGSDQPLVGSGRINLDLLRASP